MIMDEKTVLKSLRINYFVSLAAALIVLLAFELGYLEKGALAMAVSPTVMYVIEVVTIMLTVLLIPLAVKGFTNSMSKAGGLPGEEFVKLFLRKSLQRIFLLFIVIIVNEFAYYGLGYNGGLYCGLLGFGSMIYSFPTKMVFEQYSNSEK